MVHLFRGRGLPRPPMLGPRLMRPRGYRPDFIPPFGLPRGGLLNRPPMRPRPLPPPRMAPPPLPPRPGLPPPPIPLRNRPLPYPPIPPLGRGLGIPPPIPRGPALRGLIRLQPPIRGRGLFSRRGVAVKRLVPSNGLRVKKPQRRKEKTEGEFFCETCDRGWKTAEKLQEHVAEHEVCGREGCTFTAHPKVVLKHVQMQHETGLYKRISSEDAAKWIAERKSRFPTKENIERKAAQLNEMANRGERIPSQGKRFQNNSAHGNWRDRRKRPNENSIKHEVGLKKIKPTPLKLRKPSDSSQWRDPNAWRGDLPQFPGTAAFPPEEDGTNKDDRVKENFSDDEEWKESSNNVKCVSDKPAVSNILTSLIADYGSDMSDEDEEENITVPPTIETCPAVLQGEEKQHGNNGNVNDQENDLPSSLQECNKIEDSDSGPDECIIEHEDKSNIPIPQGKENRELESKQETNLGVELLKKDENDRPKIENGRVPMKRHQLSLLEKLLQSEIRHERNVILQCVHYTVKNNFFGCGNLAKHHLEES